jgi:hypothetical protein
MENNTMLKLLTKASPWMVASLLMATPGFSQNANCQPAPKNCCVKTCPATLQAPTVAAYDAPARIDTRCSWDMWIDASFIYWQPTQDNMEVAFQQTGSIVVGNTLAAVGPVGSYVQQDFGFKPGFKVGLGWAFDYHDNWDMAAEYTWLHTTQNQSGLTPSSNPAGTGFARTWGIPQATLDAATQLYNSFGSTWKMNLDVVDFNMGRWYYVGTDLTFRTFVGLRAAWIGQNHTVNYVNDGAIAATGSYVGTNRVTDYLHSWGVGPQIGLSTKWMLGEGFRIYGNAEADILYTDYTRITHKETAGPAIWAANTSNNHYGAIRPHMDLELGVAWGSYFDNNNWYFDLAAGYDFQVFFNQNMFSHGVSSLQVANKVNAGNLYLQGLTIATRVDF